MSGFVLLGLLAIVVGLLLLWLATASPVRSEARDEAATLDVQNDFD